MFAHRPEGEWAGRCTGLWGGTSWAQGPAVQRPWGQPAATFAASLSLSGMLVRSKESSWTYAPCLEAGSQGTVDTAYLHRNILSRRSVKATRALGQELFYGFRKMTHVMLIAGFHSFHRRGRRGSRVCRQSLPGDMRSFHCP